MLPPAVYYLQEHSPRHSPALDGLSRAWAGTRADVLGDQEQLQLVQGQPRRAGNSHPKENGFEILLNCEYVQ